jgi:alpha-tubulin suppressor-like RCC1 family protein
MRQARSAALFLVAGLFLASLSCGGDAAGPKVPAAPTAFQVIPTSPFAMHMTWQDNSDNEDGFRVYRGTSLDNMTTLVETEDADEVTCDDAGLQPLTTYYYKVAAFNSTGTSAWVIASAATPAAPPLIFLSSWTAGVTAIEGGANPPSATIAVTNAGGGALTGLTVGTIAFGAGQPTGWLAGDLSSTTAPATLTLHTTAGRIAAGTYTATVPVASSVATNSPQNVTVTFSVGVAPFATLSPGRFYSCGTKTTGIAYCWGDNTYGMLGDGSTTRSMIPVAVAGAVAFTTLATGTLNTCGLTADGSAYCWGWNNHGALGDGSFITKHVPVAVASGGLTFKALSVGDAFTCAVAKTAAAYCWGYNALGQLGLGIPGEDFAAPTLVAGGLLFTTISSSGAHTCGITSTGAAYCWGENHQGQLGTGDTTAHVAPAAVAGGLTFADVSVGEFSCALTTAGKVYCWGANGSGQLGNGTKTRSLVPVAVSGGLTFVTVRAGYAHACGLTAGGAAYCWGSNNGGELGNDSFLDSTSPVAVAGGLTFASLEAGNLLTCGVTTGAVAYCWGNNMSGEVGDGTNTNRRVPVKVLGQP